MPPRVAMCRAIVPVRLWWRWPRSACLTGPRHVTTWSQVNYQTDLLCTRQFIKAECNGIILTCDFWAIPFHNVEDCHHDNITCTADTFYKIISFLFLFNDLIQVLFLLLSIIHFNLVWSGICKYFDLNKIIKIIDKFLRINALQSSSQDKKVLIEQF